MGPERAEREREVRAGRIVDVVVSKASVKSILVRKVSDERPRTTGIERKSPGRGFLSATSSRCQRVPPTFSNTSGMTGRLTSRVLLDTSMPLNSKHVGRILALLVSQW